MRFTLAPNWKVILRHAHSIRPMAVVCVASALDAAFPYMEGVLPISRPVFSMLLAAVSAWAIYVRLTYQPKLSVPPVKPDEQA